MTAHLFSVDKLINVRLGCVPCPEFHTLIMRICTDVVVFLPRTARMRRPQDVHSIRIYLNKARTTRRR